MIEIKADDEKAKNERGGSATTTAIAFRFRDREVLVELLMSLVLQNIVGGPDGFITWKLERETGNREDFWCHIWEYPTQHEASLIPYRVGVDAPLDRDSEEKLQELFCCIPAKLRGGNLLRQSLEGR